jgi:hypothetical protein
VDLMMKRERWSQGVKWLLSGRRDAALYGRRDARRYIVRTDLADASLNF